jgi:hypothetical protein
MGKVTRLGWSKPSDEIPQPISILLGSNLRKNSDQASKPQKQDQVKKPQGREGP